jgi:hypothetical protein
VVSEHRKILFFLVEEKENSPCRQRRDRQSPDPEEEREMPRGRGREVQNPEVERDLHNLRARVVDMEIRQRRTADVGDISESENEDDAGHGEKKSQWKMQQMSAYLKPLQEWVQR